MSNDVETEKAFLPIRDAQRFTGLSQSRLRAFYEEGFLKGYVTPSGQRRYCVKSLREFCNISSNTQAEEVAKVNYLYARVSSKKQSDDLKRQIEFLREWSADKGVEYVVIEDIGSGINFKRKGLQTILDRCL